MVHLCDLRFISGVWPHLLPKKINFNSGNYVLSWKKWPCFGVVPHHPKENILLWLESGSYVPVIHLFNYGVGMWFWLLWDQVSGSLLLYLKVNVDIIHIRGCSFGAFWLGIISRMEHVFKLDKSAAEPDTWYSSLEVRIWCIWCIVSLWGNQGWNKLLMCVWFWGQRCSFLLVTIKVWNSRKIFRIW